MCIKAGDNRALERQLLTAGDPSEARSQTPGGPDTSGPAVLYTALALVRRWVGSKGVRHSTETENSTEVEPTLQSLG